MEKLYQKRKENARGEAVEMLGRLPARPGQGPGQRVKGGERLQSNRQKEPSAEDGLQRRVRRLERIVLILCIATILLGLAGIRLVVVVGKIIGIFEFILEQLNFIGQQVDTVRQGIQGIQ